MDYNTWRFEEEKIACVNRQAYDRKWQDRLSIIADVLYMFVTSASTILALKILPIWLVCMAALAMIAELIGVAGLVLDLIEAKKIYRAGIKAMNEFHENYPMPNPEE